MLDSFEKLEIAVALHGEATHTLSISELETKLPQLSSQFVERELDELAHAGAVQLDNGIARLALDTQDIPAMEEIALLYEEDRLLLIRTLSEISMEKMRRMARVFADALPLRRTKSGDSDG